MRIDIYHHTVPNEKEEEILSLILKNQKKIMATQAEIAQQLRDMKAQNEKSRQEVLAKFATLEQAIVDAGNSTPEVDEALSDLKSSIQTDDDLIADGTGTGTGGDTEEPV